MKRPADDEFAIKGQWVNVGGIWIFVTPGTTADELPEPIDFPASGGNYTNGKADALINLSPNCTSNPAIQGACGQDH